MSLRDFFVMGIATGDWAAQNEGAGEFTSNASTESLEERAVLYGRMADAMIKERKKGGVA